MLSLMRFLLKTIAFSLCLTVGSGVTVYLLSMICPNSTYGIIFIRVSESKTQNTGTTCNTLILVILASHMSLYKPCSVNTRHETNN